MKGMSDGFTMIDKIKCVHDNDRQNMIHSFIIMIDKVTLRPWCYLLHSQFIFWQSWNSLLHLVTKGRVSIHNLQYWNHWCEKLYNSYKLVHFYEMRSGAPLLVSFYFLANRKGGCICGDCLVKKKKVADSVLKYWLPGGNGSPLMLII